MKLDLIQPEKWEQLNELVRDRLQVSAPFQLRTFKDLGSAVMEIAQGTAQFLSHKKSVAFIRGQSPAYDFLLPHFYKETYQIKHSSYLDLTNGGANVRPWAESLSKDTVFVIYAEDHPVTGELFEFCEELDQVLNEKRIFSIRISHARFRHEERIAVVSGEAPAKPALVTSQVTSSEASPTTAQKSSQAFESTLAALPLRPYSVRICSLHEDLAVAILGERFRSPAMVAPRQSWKIDDALKTLNDSLGEKYLSAAEKKLGQEVDSGAQRKLIRDFENQLAGRGQVHFASDRLRLWDRSVVIFPDVSAEALAENIFAKLQLSAQQGWRILDTTNMCRWQSLRMFQSWWEPLPSDESLRGLLIFSLDALRTKDFAKLVLSSYEEIKQMQSWS